MLTPALERRFLASLYKKYNSNFGYGIRHLRSCAFYVTGPESFEAELPEIWDISGQTKKSQLLDWAKELNAKGWVVFSENQLTFTLTEAGYREANQGCVGRVMSYLNNNPGWAIPISIFSLIVAIIAIVVDAKAP